MDINKIDNKYYKRISSMVKFLVILLIIMFSIFLSYIIVFQSFGYLNTNTFITDIVVIAFLLISLFKNADDESYITNKITMKLFGGKISGRK